MSVQHDSYKCTMSCDLGVHIVQSFRSTALAVIKHAVFTDDDAPDAKNYENS
jgi:hypothetical protein